MDNEKPFAKNIFAINLWKTPLGMSEKDAES